MGLYSILTTKWRGENIRLNTILKFMGPMTHLASTERHTALAEVKLSELPAWLKRRNMGASGISGAISRAFWRWQHKYMQPKKVGIAPFAQVCVGAMVFFYTINYSKLKHHTNYKYHW